MWFGKQADGVLASWIAINPDGSLRTGDAANQTLTAVNPADDNNETPAVSESTELGGLYTALITSGFLIAEGTGNYKVVLERTTGPRSSAHKVLQITARDLDDLAQPGDAMTLTAGERTAIAAELLATTIAGGFTVAECLELLLHMDKIVFCDLDSGTDGTGTYADPVNNETSAAARLLAIDSRVIWIKGQLAYFTLTPGDDWTEKVFIAGVGNNAGIDPNGQVAEGSTFLNLSFQEVASTGFGAALFGMTFNDCFILGQLTVPTSVFYRCRFATATGARFRLLTNSTIQLLDCAQHRTTALGQPLFVDFQSLSGVEIVVHRFGGRIILGAMASATARCMITSTQADVFVESTCSAGNVELIGAGAYAVDPAATVTFDADKFDDGARITVTPISRSGGLIRVTTMLSRNGRIVTTATRATLQILNSSGGTVFDPSDIAGAPSPVSHGAYVFSGAATIPTEDTLTALVTITDGIGLVSAQVEGIGSP